VRRHHRVEVEPLDPLLFDLDHSRGRPNRQNPSPLQRDRDW
jgi:hypothetical protein